VDDDRGVAVVEAVLVSVLLLTLLLAVVQVGIYLHVRNVVAASAAEGARYGANADVDSALSAQRTREIVGQALSERTAQSLSCAPGEEAGTGGTVLVAVRCTGRVPTFFAPLGDVLPLDVTGRALKEGR